MNNKINKLVLVITVSLGLLILASCTQKNENKQVLLEENIKEQKVEEQLEEKIIVEEKQVKKLDLYNYVPYSGLDQIKDSKKLNVLFFNTSDSSNIQTLKDNLQQSGIHDGLVMYEIDFDTNSELKEKYNVTEAHTFVQVDNDGNIMRKWNGSKTIGEMHISLTSGKTLVK